MTWYGEFSYVRVYHVMSIDVALCYVRLCLVFTGEVLGRMEMASMAIQVIETSMNFKTPNFPPCIS